MVAALDKLIREFEEHTDRGKKARTPEGGDSISLEYIF
jgi:hypothetical protein